MIIYQSASTSSIKMIFEFLVLLIAVWISAINS